MPIANDDSENITKAGNIRRPLFRRVLIVNMTVSLALAGAAVAAAFLAVGKAVEASARADIEAELRILEAHGERHELFGYAKAIDYRILPAEDAKADANAFNFYTPPEGDNNISLYVYLLTRADHSPIVGNLAQWPEGVKLEPGWRRFDGKDAGAAPGTIIAKVKPVYDDRFQLLVGRRLATYDALYRGFIPAMIAIALVMAALSALFTNRIADEFRQRVALLNNVFNQVHRGGVNTRVSSSALMVGDELAKLGQEINDALDEIARLMKGLDAVSQAAAHELNKEIARLQSLARDSGVTALEEGADDVQRLLREILELARIESSPAAELRPLNITQAIREAVTLYQDTYEDKGVMLTLSSADPDAMILGRAPLITNLAANLLSNALKHTPESGAVTVMVAANGGAITLSVADTGPGTDTEDIAELIARGARGPVAGYGFGLRFVQAVAIRHGARVTLKNQSPGLKITITFPRTIK